ncbi:MAG: hypothetical protein Q8P67_22740 [archaeon]|nr:hypothetical protein [archaeon]
MAAFEVSTSLPPSHLEDLQEALNERAIRKHDELSPEGTLMVFLRGSSHLHTYYSLVDSPVKVVFLTPKSPYDPPRFPDFRFTRIIRHAMISETGELPPVVRYEMKQAWKSRTEHRLLGLLRSLHDFLSVPFYLDFSDELIEELSGDCGCGHSRDGCCKASVSRSEYYDRFRAAQKQLADQQFKQWGELNLIREQTIAAYRQHGPFLKGLYQQSPAISASWFDPSFSRPLSEILQEDCPQVYSFPFFTRDFCQSFMQELATFRGSGLPAAKPNSMNNYGVVLDDIGLEEFFVRLIDTHLRPIACELYPDIGASLDSHHGFVVEYSPEGDKDLDMHIDDSEVTFNINLDDQFSGSSLVFCGMHRTNEERKHSASYHHQLGRCVVHRGTHRHGAAAIAEGARTNLIIWCRSSSFRQQMVRHSHRSPENSSPDMVCLSRTHDPDYHQFASLFTK